MATATLSKPARHSSSSGGGHGHFRHVTKPATQGEFLESLGMSKRRYAQIIEKYTPVIERLEAKRKR